MNPICIDRVAATVLSLLGIEKEEKMAEPIPEITEAGKADRVFMYNPDAIAQWIFEKYEDDFAPVLSEADHLLSMRSVFMPVTPVCFASMYSGLQPEDHGIREYVKPVLTCRTIFDVLPEQGKKVAIVSTKNDSISMIFLNRPIDYFIYPTKEECNEKAKELIKEDKHDVIILYNGDYDHWIHRVSPTGKRALKALKENIATYVEIRELIRTEWKDHRTALAFAPDHGCHRKALFFGTHGINEDCDMDIRHIWTFLPKEKNRSLKSVYYSRGGGMLGDRYNVTLSAENDGSGTVQYVKRIMHSAPEVKKSGRINAEAIAELFAIADEFGMQNWKDLPKSDLIVMDAPTIRFEIEFSDGERIGISSSDEWPANARDGIDRMLKEILSEAGIEEKKEDSK